MFVGSKFYFVFGWMIWTGYSSCFGAALRPEAPALQTLENGRLYYGSHIGWSFFDFVSNSQPAGIRGNGAQLGLALLSRGSGRWSNVLATASAAMISGPFADFQRQYSNSWWRSLEFSGVEVRLGARAELVEIGLVQQADLRTGFGLDLRYLDLVGNQIVGNMGSRPPANRLRTNLVALTPVLFLIWRPRPPADATTAPSLAARMTRLQGLMLQVGMSLPLWAPYQAQFGNSVARVSQSGRLERWSYDVSVGSWFGSSS